MLNKFEFKSYSFEKYALIAALFARTAHLGVYTVNDFTLSRLCSLAEFRDAISSICTLLAARALHCGPGAKKAKWAHASSEKPERPKASSDLAQTVAYLANPGCAGTHHFGIDFHNKNYDSAMYLWTPTAPKVLRTLEFINQLVYDTERHPVATAVALSSTALVVAVNEAIAELESDCGAIVPNKALIQEFLGRIRSGCHLVVQLN